MKIPPEGSNKEGKPDSEMIFSTWKTGLLSWAIPGSGPVDLAMSGAAPSRAGAALRPRPATARSWDLAI